MAIGLFLCYAVLAYLILALFVPLFFWCFFRRVKPKARAAIALAATVLLAGSASAVTSKTNAPYIVPLVGRVLTGFAVNSFYRGLCNALTVIRTNLSTLDIPGLLQGESIHFWYFTGYFLLGGYLILCLSEKLGPKLSDWRHGKAFVLDDDERYMLLALYLMAGLLLGYCVLYDGYSWTLCRGTNTAFLPALLCMAFVKQKRSYIKLLVCWMVLAGVSVWNYYDWYLAQRQDAAAYTIQILEESEKLADVIPMDPNADPWENTIADYNIYDYRALALPTGAGVQVIMHSSVVENSRYAAIGRGNEYEEMYIQDLAQRGYSIVLQDDFFTILRRK